MSIKKIVVRAAAPLALLALGACATGLPTQVSRFQAMPAPSGHSFIIEAADAANRGGLEFSQYASLVRQHLIAEGYREAASRADATLIVNLDYGVDDGRQQVVVRPDPFYPSFGRPYFSRFGYRGYRRSPFYWGWHDPFWGGGDRIDSYTIYQSYVDLDIRRASDGQAVFEGLAQARSRSNQLQALVPNLVEALFTNFPGNSGETVRITVRDDDRRR